MEDAEKLREAMEKEFPDWLVPHEKSATEASQPPSKTPPAMAYSDQHSFQNDKVGSFRNKRKRFVDLASERNRENRVMSIFDSHVHDSNIKRSLDNERWHRDRDEIIPLEKVSQDDVMPELPPTLHELVKGMAMPQGYSILASRWLL